MASIKINPAHKKKLAELFNVTGDYVSKVVNNKRHNKSITDAYALLVKEEQKALNKVSKMTSTKTA